MTRARPTDQTDTSDREVLAGLVERVTFHNAENGFCVLRIKARGHRELITVVGHAATIAAGEWVTASGEWVNDHTHGQQFKARFMRTSAPTSIDGIEKYLGSGMIRGIGPVYAKKMVKAFGEKVFDIIEAEPDRLREVTGIGQVRAKRITDAWAEQKIVREIMVFLHSHTVGTARAVRIYKARFSAVTKDRVGCYVYLLLDPRDGRPFYVGKGKGGRVFKHLAAARRGADGAKSDRIREFYEAGLESNLDILRYGLDDASAFNVEAAALLAMAATSEKCFCERRRWLLKRI